MVQYMQCNVNIIFRAFLALNVMQLMGSIAAVKNSFLRGLSAIYLFAFASLYVQVPGLYGENGILPVKSLLTNLERDGLGAFKRANTQRPSLVWLAPLVGLQLGQMVELMTLAGTFLSLAGLIFVSWRSKTMYFICWGLYFSVYQVGGVFMQFQWDILLLETGILAILLAPLRPKTTRDYSPSDRPVWSLVRWLLFRFMFSSGAVKLTSGCPVWWSLSALSIHFESQPLPNQLSWFAHQLPSGMLKFGVVWTFVAELAIPFMFYAPNSAIRRFAFWTQVLFQLGIILTGNYNFFNLLTIVLCLSLLLDEDFNFKPTEENIKQPVWYESISIKLVYLALGYWSIKFFDLAIVNGTPTAKINFTDRDFHKFLTYTVPASMWLGAGHLIFSIAQAIIESVVKSNFVTRPFSFLKTILVSSVAIWLFCISTVPYSASLESESFRSLWPIVRKWHARVDHLHLVSAYGLFRVMTGVGGRPELIIEGGDSPTGPWKEFQFIYKPGNVTAPQKFNVPHQPRLDWQLWFAALGSHPQEGPWFDNFIYRLLEGESTVLDLLDRDHMPRFLADRPPRYIRVLKYKYRYTSRQASGPLKRAWWTRTLEGIWMPATDRTRLEPRVEANGIETTKKIQFKVKNPLITWILSQSVKWIAGSQATNIIYSLFGASLLFRLFSV